MVWIRWQIAGVEVGRCQENVSGSWAQGGGCCPLDCLWVTSAAASQTDRWAETANQGFFNNGNIPCWARVGLSEVSCHRLGGGRITPTKSWAGNLTALHCPPCLTLCRRILLPLGRDCQLHANGLLEVRLKVTLASCRQPC